MWISFTLALTAVFGGIAADNLANFRPVSNDEVELIAVGFQLATRGVFGSEMYAGFFGADQHYLWTPPLQHVLDAATFRVFGGGVAQARGVSVAAAVALVWLVGGLAFRWYGLATAVLCEVLLTVWRSGLAGAPSGLPLLSVARAARYDVLAVAFAWLAIWALDGCVRHPRQRRAFFVGVCSGLAALAQFFGVFTLALVTLGWVWIGRAGYASRLVWIGAGAALVLWPWVLFIAANAADFAGQLLVYGGRGDYLRPAFYVANMVAEPGRYADLRQPPADVAMQVSWGVLVLGVWPAVLFVGWRAVRHPTLGDRLLWLSLLTFAGLLVVLDGTKTPLYAILLVPSICLALAVGWVALARWMALRRGLRWLAAATGLVVLAMLLVDGVRAYRLDLTQARAVSAYLDVGRTLDAALEPRGTVLGPERWWWALQAHPYVSLRSVWFQWVARATPGSNPPEFVEWVRRTRPANIIVNNNIRDDVRDFPEPLPAQFGAYLADCAQPVASIDDPTYLDIVVYRVLDPAPVGCG